MFEGSAALEKGMHDKLVTSNGGSLNGSTWSDFTNYYEMMPSNASGNRSAHFDPVVDD